MYTNPTHHPPRKARSTYQRMGHKELIATIATIIVGILLLLFFEHHHRARNEHTQSANRAAGAAQSSVAPATSSDAKPAFNKQRYSLSNPSSIWVIANKKHQLAPAAYVPANLVVPAIPLRLDSDAEEMHIRSDTASALQVLVTAAKQDDIHLMLASGYRSYAFQRNLYNGYVRTQGQAAADTQSARPGYSEHQTGLSADLEPTSRKCEVEQCFGDLPEGKWLAANAYKYGFIIRYPADKTAVTGYEYEPWHIRYLGTALSTELHSQGVTTLEEFFNIAGGSSYY